MATTTDRQKAKKVAIIKLRFHLIISIFTLLLILIGTCSKKQEYPEPVIKSIKIEKKVASLKKT